MADAEKLIALYTRAGERLLELIRSLESGSYSRRRREKILQQIVEILAGLTDGAAQSMAELLAEAYKEGVDEAANSMISQGVPDEQINTVLEPLIHQQAVQAIMDESFLRILEATDNMSQDAKRRVEDAVRTATERMLTDSVNRRLATKEAVTRLTQQGITGIVTKNGARIPAEKYMAGVVQYNLRKAHVTGAENTIVQNGLDLVYVNYVGITCEYCAKYQGRVYSISGTHPRFPRLDARPPYHAHCVHSLSAWIEEYQNADDVERMIELSNRPFTDNRTEANIRRYNEIQRDKARKNETRKQWIRYKATLPNDTPNLRQFASLKARDAQTYRELQEAYRKANDQIKRTTPNYGLIASKNTEIPDAKLTQYALDPNHPKGKDKARVFQSALGYNQSNYKDLIKNVDRNLGSAPAYFRGSTPYGDKYEVILPLQGPNGKTANVLTAWMMKDGKARLTSIYVKD
ncbi:phage minor capsid protein [Paenibacillus sp. FSL R7-0216]|uniref:phage minor capsid protein n=1 Tax=Paenibacillus sp. FSL R7-0216 TaxID=2921677 RepID=UPI0030DAE406